MMTATKLLQLAPTDLRNERNERYDGSGFSITLGELATTDAHLIGRIYGILEHVYGRWREMQDDPRYELLAEKLGVFNDKKFLEAVQNIGLATYREKTDSPELRKALHDVRGGGLTSLIGYVQFMPRLAGRGQLPDSLIKNLAYLARDHAKMMRNIFEDLDRAKRQADEQEKLHHIDEFVSKWRDFVYRAGRQQVRVEATATFDGYITNRCLETSAVDRILYNYINNAVRFAADDRVQLIVLPVSERLTRWVVVNRITDGQRRWLAENVGDNLAALFEGGLTRGGHGVGLSGCADFVASSFGVETETALQKKYLGAALDARTYYAWFHWPVYVPQSANEPVCDCAND